MGCALTWNVIFLNPTQIITLSGHKWNTYTLGSRTIRRITKLFPCSHGFPSASVPFLFSTWDITAVFSSEIFLSCLVSNPNPGRWAEMELSCGDNPSPPLRGTSSWASDYGVTLFLVWSWQWPYKKMFPCEVFSFSELLEALWLSLLSRRSNRDGGWSWWKLRTGESLVAAFFLLKHRNKSLIAAFLQIFHCLNNSNSSSRVVSPLLWPSGCTMERITIVRI